MLDLSTFLDSSVGLSWVLGDIFVSFVFIIIGSCFDPVLVVVSSSVVVDAASSNTSTSKGSKLPVEYCEKITPLSFSFDGKGTSIEFDPSALLEASVGFASLLSIEFM